MQIGELAERTGVSPRSVRYYEQQGLLRPSRSPAGHRVFEPRDVDRVLAIQELLAAGFCSKVIKVLLPEVLDPDAAGRDALLARFLDAQARLEDERRDIDRELGELHQLARSLGLDLDAHVRSEDRGHESDREHPSPSPSAPPDHRDRRLR